MGVRAIVLAAGKGTRMNTSLPKCAHSLNGKPMIIHIIDNLRKAGVNDIVVVVGYGKEIMYNILHGKCDIVVQEKQNGTAAAVKAAEREIGNYNGFTLITLGDMPLISPMTFERLIACHVNNEMDFTVATTIHPTPFGYGRIVRDGLGNVSEIIEEKDCTKEEKEIAEINSSIYVVDNKKLFECVGLIDNNNGQREYKLTDIVKIFREKKYRVQAVVVDNYREITGINDQQQLVKAEKWMNNCN